MERPAERFLYGQEKGAAPLRRGKTKILQLNIGLHCNQACSHCHVESSPLRHEAMTRETADRCLYLLEKASQAPGDRGDPGALPLTLDLTGGAPELQPQFRWVYKHDARLSSECTVTRLLLSSFLSFLRSERAVWPQLLVEELTYWSCEVL